MITRVLIGVGRGYFMVCFSGYNLRSIYFISVYGFKFGKFEFNGLEWNVVIVV